MCHEPRVQIPQGVSQWFVMPARMYSTQDVEEPCVHVVQLVGIFPDTRLVALVIHKKQPGAPVGNDLQCFLCYVWVGACDEQAILQSVETPEGCVAPKQVQAARPTHRTLVN